jgi:heptosyltransferase-2
MFNRIAFLKLCCPGDLLFTTPAIRAVKHSFPEARLFYLTGKYSQFIPQHNPHIDETIIVEPPFEINGSFAAFKSFIRGVAAIARNDFDLVVSFHRARAVSAMCKLGGAGKVAGFSTAKPFVSYATDFDYDKHEVLRNIDLVSAFGVKPDGEQMEYITTAYEDEQASDLLSQHKIPDKYVIIIPGGGENPGTTMHIKRWPTEYFKEICDFIRQHYNLPVVAVGGPSEKELAESIGADYNLAGLTTFAGLAPILKRAALVISNDSGPLYLASAVGARTIGIYGPSSAQLVAPLVGSHRSVWFPVWCQPCYSPQTVTRGNFSCHTGTWDCMKKLEPELVKNAIGGLLGN